MPSPGALLTDPAWAGARLAAVRAGGVWLTTARWTPAQWLTWPSETANRLATSGSARNRAHVTIGAGDQTAIWTRARAGSACAVLANGPGGERLGSSASAFVAQFRRTFPAVENSKTPAAGCTAVTTLSDSGARALNAAAADEGTGLEIPTGGLVTPPLAVGEPAQVTVQLGPDPLGLAAGIGVTSDDFWLAARAVVTARGAGVASEAQVAGDGSVTLRFTPTQPGTIALRLVMPGAAVSRALGGPTEIVGPLTGRARKRRPDHRHRGLARRLGAGHPADEPRPVPRQRGDRGHRPLDLGAVRGPRGGSATSALRARLRLRTRVTTGVLRHFRISRM